MPAAISAPQPLAVEAGARVLMSGGNAVDAAVTAALVQAIVNPQMCGIGGYAVINLHLANEQGSVGVDAPALAGALVRDDMWVEKLIRPNPGGWGFFLEGNVNEAGYTSVCTPGAVKMYAMLLDRWGTIDFGQAAQPAIRIAHDGYTVSDALAVAWKRSNQYWEGLSLREYILKTRRRAASICATMVKPMTSAKPCATRTTPRPCVISSNMAARISTTAS